MWGELWEALATGRVGQHLYEATLQDLPHTDMVFDPAGELVSLEDRRYVCRLIEQHKSN